MNKLLAQLNRLNNLTHKLETGLLVVLFLGVMLLSVGLIITRNTFGFGFYWADPLARTLVLWICLLGAMSASFQKKHISIDLVNRFVSAQCKRIINLIIWTLTACVTAAAAYYSFKFVELEYDSQTVLFANVPAWLLQSIMPISFLIMSARYVLNTLNLLFGQPQSDSK